jgi:hypothetical protein
MLSEGQQSPKFPAGNKNHEPSLFLPQLYDFERSARRIGKFNERVIIRVIMMCEEERFAKIFGDRWHIPHLKGHQLQRPLIC